ncbi:MAG TPA: isocitrate/isopropylmalate family dehydrogenase [Acidimicrobiales bacterium]|nr:isocitrate/isopropylmalate family dehydrogenase [Acidimicrobiales bacterium]
MRRVTLLVGEGIGPEVMAVAERVVQAVSDVSFERAEIGRGALERLGSALPSSTLDSISRNGVALKGPVATPSASQSYRSVNVALRKPLGLFAQLRTVRTWPGLGVPDGVDLVVARETTEEFLAGAEFPSGSAGARRALELAVEATGTDLDLSSAVSMKLVSPAATQRFFRLLFDWMHTAGRHRVTVAHKATIQRSTDGLFLALAREMAAAEPSIEMDELLVDAVAAELCRHPADFDVIACPALYGDILSDLAAGLMGGLGLAPGANLGGAVAVFEPVHGTAPRLAGRDRANPTAAVLTAAMLLDHLGLQPAAAAVREAVAGVFRRRAGATYDVADRLGCEVVGTSRFGDLLLDELAR